LPARRTSFKKKKKNGLAKSDPNKFCFSFTGPGPAAAATGDSQRQDSCGISAPAKQLHSQGKIFFLKIS
jgi:hypothetical protein